jgi:hypothetical protein
MFLFQKPFLGLVWHGSEALPFAEEGEEQYKTHFRRRTLFLVNSKGVGAFFCPEKEPQFVAPPQLLRLIRRST